MKILVDAFGGDKAPLEIIKGCILSAKENPHIEVAMIGDTKKINECAEENGLDISGFELHNAEGEITMEDDPGVVLKEKKGSSMAVGLKLAADGEGDAFVSAGNSGAITLGATMIVKRIKGVKRPAFAPIMPTSAGPFMLIDGGANVEVRAEMLRQFGIMGSVYMEKILGIKNPRVALANVGTEDHKGGPLQHEAFALLKETDLNFIGNTEARDIPAGVADVIVADGFTGNVIAKMYEGAAKEIVGMFKGVFYKSLKTKLAALMLKKEIYELKQYLDYNRYGGAVVMGVNKPVFKAHGSANEVAIAAAIRSAADFAKTGAISIIADKIAEIKTKEE
ncbi:MAG: phosphate acyltransferase PlsX [Clostridia bacterium]|nr:phosphate acyltransferase PlsX [Clostridia bacterium]